MVLARTLQVQAIAFMAYGVGFLLIPEVLNDSILGWADTETVFSRVIGGAFIGIAWLERNLSQEVDRRPRDAWPLALIPSLFVVGFLWEKIADSYTGPDTWWWVNLIVSATFAVLVATSIVAADRR